MSFLDHVLRGVLFRISSIAKIMVLRVAYAKQFAIDKLKNVVAGGETGHDSIHNGIVEIAGICPPDTAVMIHDAIRPMVGSDVIADNLSVYMRRGMPPW